MKPECVQGIPEFASRVKVAWQTLNLWLPSEVGAILERTEPLTCGVWANLVLELNCSILIARIQQKCQLNSDNAVPKQGVATSLRNPGSTKRGYYGYVTLEMLHFYPSLWHNKGSERTCSQKVFKSPWKPATS